jgi:hypothetical protein
MGGFVKGLLTTITATALGIGIGLLLDLVAGQPLDLVAALIVGLGFGFLYGLEAGIVNAYPLQQPKGWLFLLIDFTWSLPNTIFGFVLGNLIYIWVGTPSADLSEDRGWIAFKPRGSGDFGNRVLQTLGTVNLGGAGNHELVHLLQARIFGPLYLPLFGVNYVLNSAVQILWTVTVGLILWAVRVRERPWFDVPERTTSAVRGFFGWIYRFTLFEIWAYATE